MSCKPVSGSKDCKCQKAVERAYKELVELGEPESVALDAATIVYGFHHPEDTIEQRITTVERWVHDGHVH